MVTYSKGSEWRKWDLHIHSNASDGKCSPSEIIETAKEKRLSVIALTDHHTVKNLDETKKIGRQNGITVISGIEFRTEYGSKSVHMIGLFPDEYDGINLTQTALHDNILAKLDISETNIIAKGRECNPQLDDDAAFKNGMFKVQVDFKKAADLIHHYGGIVTVHAGNKTNSIEEMKHSGHGTRNVHSSVDSLGPVKEELLNSYIDVCEVRNTSESRFYLKTFGRPSIAASDAHDKEEIGRNYSWIKANPSFDGLLQIKYEPDTRVRIQEEFPNNKASYTMIDYVEIKHQLFSNKDDSTKIFFNPNLTCIIGGKSTGKSLLLNNIAYAIDSEQVIKKYNITQPENRKKGNNGLFTPLNGFVVHWSDGSESSPIQPSNKKIVFIPQTYLNRLSDEREETTEIDEIIKEILMQNEDIKACYEKCQVEMEALKKHTDKIIYDYVNVLDKIHICQKQLLDNNNSKTIQKEISKLEEEQKQYAALAQISEDQSNLYNTWSQEIQNLKTKQSYLMHDKQVLIDETHILVQLPTTFQELQSDIKDQMNEFLQQLQAKIDETWISKQQDFISSIENQSKEIEGHKAELTQKIKEIQPIIENHTNFINISKKISNEKKKLLFAEKTENNLAILKQTLSDLLMQLVQNINKYHNILENYAKHVNEKESLKVEGLEFKLEVVLRVDALKSYLLQVLNNKTLSRFKDIDISKFDLTCYTEDNLKKLIVSLQESNSTSLELKSQYSFENVLRALLSNWYNINYVVTMDNDDFENMSPGKKALVLLKLLIGLAKSDCPMLIDQPEDDLDNRSIFDDLVKYIKSKKIERQIIIVTHNANIVVGADSEEVIVANQNGQNTPNKNFRFEYISGAIEDNWINKNDQYVLSSQGIQEHICDILEGGRSAFDKRNKKYDFIRQPIKP